MKTLSRYALVLLGLAAPLALRAAEVAKASARTDVVFEQPEKFTDVKDSDFGTDKGRDAILERLRESIVERADKALPAGQKLVKADWIRLKPTKAASQSHFGLTQCAKAKLSRTIVPARIRTARSIVIRVNPSN